MSQNLSITQSGAVARITLTQSEIRNAFSDEIIAEITAAFIDVGGRADVRAEVVLLLCSTRCGIWESKACWF